MSERKITISQRQSGAILASGTEPVEVFGFEGYWYFDPDKVNKEMLKVTERTYNCSYKGICFWVDLVGENGTARNVAWVYEHPMPGYERIANRYGFYAGRRDDTVAEVKLLP